MIERPYLSVIVPAFNAGEHLPRCLRALRSSDLDAEAWELIVVDDASTDNTALVAAQYADIVVRLPGKPRGPAYARNRGCEVSRGEVLVFVDSDVCPHRETLSRFRALLTDRPDVTAAFGAYDLDPPSGSAISEYRNLLPAYAHRRKAGEAETFWAACGAVRRGAFVEVGMFDEWHDPRTRIEDMELGRRLRRAGHRILCVPEIQAKHLKRWTLGQVLAADFRGRSVPSRWLRLYEGRLPELRDRRAEWSVTLAAVALVTALAAVLAWNPWPLVASAVAAALVIGVNQQLLRFLFRQRGWRVSLAAMPLQIGATALDAVSAMVSWILRHVLGTPQPPADVEAEAAIELNAWPPTPARPPASLWSERSPVTRP